MKLCLVAFSKQTKVWYWLYTIVDKLKLNFIEVLDYALVLRTFKVKSKL